MWKLGNWLRYQGCELFGARYVVKKRCQIGHRIGIISARITRLFIDAIPASKSSQTSYLQSITQLRQMKLHFCSSLLLFSTGNIPARTCYMLLRMESKILIKLVFLSWHHQGKFLWTEWRYQCKCCASEWIMEVDQHFGARVGVKNQCQTSNLIPIVQSYNILVSCLFCAKLGVKKLIHFQNAKFQHKSPSLNL